MPGDDVSRTIVLAVGGGIAAYKAVHVASRLTRAGHAVHVQMTAAATRFVTPLSFTSVARRRTMTGMFDPPESDAESDLYPHLYPASEADVFAVLPATANLLAKLAHGIGDDLVSSSALALTPACRRYVCPAMNVHMWRQPVVQENLALLRERGWRQIGPGSGALACGVAGEGRMTEPDDIVERLVGDLAAGERLRGRRVLVVSGPTVEHLDPVRFLSNHSSGKMGQALALAAAQQGATVEFVSGPVAPVNLPDHPLVTHHPVTSAAEMLDAARGCFEPADAAIFVAAVADYRPAEPADTKRPKQSGKVTLELEPTPDIAASLGAMKRSGQVCLGFALETDNGLDKARAKLGRKQLDGIVLNGVDSFGAEAGEFTLVTDSGEEAWGRLDKTACAQRLLAYLASRLG